MQLILFSVALACFYCGTFFGLRLWMKRQNGERLSVKLPAAVASFLVSVFVFGMAVCYVLFSVPKLSGYTMLVCLFVAVLVAAAKWPEQKKVWMPIVCMAGTYVLHRLLPAMPVGCWTYVSMVVVWLAVMSLVVFFDYLPLLSFFTIATWAFAFASVIFIDGAIPLLLPAACWLIVAPLWAIIQVSAVNMMGRLGPYASAFLGFVMGGIIAVCIGFGSYNSALSLMSYYLFEGVFFVLALIGFHPFGMEKGEAVYIIALKKGNPARVLKMIFYHLIILALVAVLAWQTRYIWSVSLMITIVLLDMYNKFKFGKTDVSMRQLWHDTKSFWRQRKANATSELKEENKEKATHKKVTKTTKTKGKKKK